jgi:hypothetical protein
MYRETTNSPAQVFGLNISSATGKTMDDWSEILDASNGTSLKDKEIVQLLMKQYKVSPEWSSIITSNYFELRGINSKPDNSVTFDTSATKTLAVALHVIEEYFSDESLRLSWMELPLTAVKIQTGKSIRYEGLKEGVLLVTFNGKSQDKCQITIQHLKLANEETAGKMQEFWKEKLNVLAKVLGIS